MLSGVGRSETARDAAETVTRRQSGRHAPEAALHKAKLSSYSIQRYKRFWEVRAPSGELVCLTVYKRGAKEVVRRLGSA